jgi:hypothetical protein
MQFEPDSKIYLSRTENHRMPKPQYLCSLKTVKIMERREFVKTACAGSLAVIAGGTIGSGCASQTTV